MNIYELMMKELRAGGDKVAVSEDIVKQCNKAIEDYEAEIKRKAEEKAVQASVDKIVEGMNEYLTIKYGQSWALVDKEIVMEALEGVYGVLAAFGNLTKAAPVENTKPEATVVAKKSAVSKTLTPEDVENIIDDWIKVLA